MTFNCLTLFPEMFEGFMASSLMGRAVESGAITIRLVNFRDYTTDKHGRVDDYPFGGAPGMLLAAQPLFDCFDDIVARMPEGQRCRNIFMSPGGRVLRQADARRLASEYDTLNILCGHYEGVDQRVLDSRIDEEISIGDYILTGGELPAMVLMDCVARLVPGVVGNPESVNSESFTDGLLEYPQYTRPYDFRGMTAPDILLSGHHARIEEWKRAKAVEKTWRMRPDLLDGANLGEADRRVIEELEKKEETGYEASDQGH